MANDPRPTILTVSHPTPIVKKALIIAAILVVLLAGTGMMALRFSPIGQTIRQANNSSAMVSLEEQFVDYLESYRKAHGAYPESIETAAIDFTKTDRATPEMLGALIYARTGDTYVLRASTTQ
jgi:hypothetical protein